MGVIDDKSNRNIFQKSLVLEKPYDVQTPETLSLGRKRELLTFLLLDIPLNNIQKMRIQLAPEWHPRQKQPLANKEERSWRGLAQQALAFGATTMHSAQISELTILGSKLLALWLGPTIELRDLLPKLLSDKVAENTGQAFAPFFRRAGNLPCLEVEAEDRGTEKIGPAIGSYIWVLSSNKWLSVPLPAVQAGIHLSALKSLLPSVVKEMMWKASCTYIAILTPLIFYIVALLVRRPNF
ncbi:hypothetical protein MKZ38_003939 [Zalerion maritima]|uniref:Uncharacterized protein n=1 Tax=Zalerion maritima TaxID=339359 RepID=A0AAD5RMT2_9PEZI|nr:hypothetical protein MKZ38_003939 [Zalerion maritima]